MGKVKVINSVGKVLEVDEKKAALLTRQGVWKKFDGAMPVDAVLGAEIVEKERVELVANIEAFETEKAAFELEKAEFEAAKAAFEAEKKAEAKASKKAAKAEKTDETE